MIPHRTIPLPDDAATQALGARLASGIPSGLIVWLQGDLGAGKTTLVRGLLHALGVSGRVKSPTFALVELYELSRLSFYHFDFYRFDDPREFEHSGLSEHFGTDAVCLVEWPERAGPALPTPDVRISLEIPNDGGRVAHLDACSPRGKAWLNAALG
ncbi:MAG: tRNA (adenosine(37)-N6)-threonylcarbamoyltransferase complex ATPase subunit type 1 TsaE [Burkholderiales bacterium]